MGYTVWVSLRRERPLAGGELEELAAHVARHQRADWPEPYRLTLTLGRPDAGLALDGRMKVGHDEDVIARYLAVLTELRGVFPGATCDVGDDLSLVRWDGAAYVLGPPAGAPVRGPGDGDDGDRAVKVALTGVKRDNQLMYYVKATGVWAVPRKKPGEEKGKPILVAEAAVDMDHGRYLYFVDSDGDIVRKLRR